MTTNENREIIAGPSREDMFDALRLYEERRYVSFTVVKADAAQGISQRFRVEGLTFGVRVRSIRTEDGSGESWLLSLHDKDGVFGSHYLDAHFNTTTRQGWIRPKETEETIVS